MVQISHQHRVLVALGGDVGLNKTQHALRLIGQYCFTSQGTTQHNHPARTTPTFEFKLSVFAFPTLSRFIPTLLPKKLFNVTLDVVSQPELKQIPLPAPLQSAKHRLAGQSRISTHQLGPLVRCQTIEYLQQPR